MEDIARSIGYWIHDLGIWGYPLAVTLMAGVAVLPIPAEIPAAVNGMLFGPAAGVAVTWIGAMVGASISFELARRFGRPLVERVLPSRYVGVLDVAVLAVSWPGLLVARLIPVVAFTALNWGLGLTLCRRSTFLWTTALGIIPGTVFFVYSGEGLARLYARHPVLAVALAVVAAGVLYMASRRVNRRSERKGAAPDGSV